MRPGRHLRGLTGLTGLSLASLAASFSSSPRLGLNRVPNTRLTAFLGAGSPPLLSRGAGRASLPGVRGMAASSTSPRRKGGNKVSLAPSGPPALKDSTPRHLVLTDGFLEEGLAAELRKVYDDRFANPRSTDSDRFVWDYWHVPDQYTLVRTSAEEFFGADLYAKLCNALTDYGQQNLGCNSITQPWLSFYVDGCEQRMHTDSWHGPFAYVLSLTAWEERDFTGGETFIMSPKVLDYWRGFDASKGLEEETMQQKVEPRFNRLTIFDPRFPHGVKQVRGTRDPRKARVVLHGWFTDLGAPFYMGGLPEEDASAVLNKALEPLYEELSKEVSRVTGVLNVRLTVRGSDGVVSAVQAVADTLVPDPDDLVDGWSAEDVREALLSLIERRAKDIKFPPAQSGLDSSITLPFVFE